MISDVLLDHIGYATDGEKIWYIAGENGFLMEIDIKDVSLSCLTMIPRENDKSEQYRMLTYYENIIYLLPYNSKVLYEYSVKDANLRKVEFGIANDLSATGAAIRNGYLYIYGNDEVIVKYCLSSREYVLIYISEKADLLTGRKDRFWTYSNVVNNMIYIPYCKSNRILVIDANDGIQTIMLGQKLEHRLNSVIQVGEERIFTLHFDDKGVIYSDIYDLVGNAMEHYEIEFSEAYDIYPYVTAEFVDNQWILYAYKNNLPFVIVNSLRNIRKLEPNFEKNNQVLCDDYLKQCRHNSHICVGKEDMYSVDFDCGRFLEINKNSKKIMIKDLQLIKNDRNILKHYKVQSKNVVVREAADVAALKDYIEMLL